jgi:hypothetical protein
VTGPVGFPEWDHEVIPILRWLKIQEDHQGVPGGLQTEGIDELVAAVQIPRAKMLTQLRRMIDDNLLQGEWLPCIDGGVFLRGIVLTGDGLRALGTWPSHDITPETLKAVFEQAIWAAKSPDERTRLERLRDAALDLGRDTFVSVMGELAKQAAGQALG